MDPAASERSDEELLRAARDEPEAFAVFYRRHVRALSAYFWRRSRDAETTADLTAETFAAALDGCARFDPARGPAIGWLYGIAHRQLGTLARRGAVEQRARRRLGMARLELDDERAGAHRGRRRPGGAAGARARGARRAAGRAARGRRGARAARARLRADRDRRRARRRSSCESACRAGWRRCAAGWGGERDERLLRTARAPARRRGPAARAAPRAGAARWRGRGRPLLALATRAARGGWSSPRRSRCWARARRLRRRPAAVPRPLRPPRRRRRSPPRRRLSSSRCRRARCRGPASPCSTRTTISRRGARGRRAARGAAARRSHRVGNAADQTQAQTVVGHRPAPRRRRGSSPRSSASRDIRPVDRRRGRRGARRRGVVVQVGSDRRRR